MTSEHKNYIFIACTIAAVLFGYTYFLQEQRKFNAITSFKECLDAGYLVMGTYPEECKIPGKKFINPNQTKQVASSSQEMGIAINDFKNKSYLIEGQSILFKNGEGKLPPVKGISSSTSTFKQTSTILSADVNNDTKEDTVFLLQNTSTPSKDLYITASISLYNDFTGINGIYIGKNITNAKLTYEESRITLEYVMRNSKEKNYIYYKFENGILKEYN